MNRKGFEFSMVFLFFFGTLVFSISCHACQEVEKQDDKYPEMLTMQVRVVDPDGFPVENATVSTWALRLKVERSGHYGWSEKLWGPPPKLKTNTEGLVDLPYPKYLKEELETGTVSILVEHPDFVAYQGDRSVDQQPAVVQLKIGFRIAATAVDGDSSEPIKQDLYGVSSDESRPEDWKLTNNGTLVSPVFEAKMICLRLAKIVPGEPTLYSELIEIDPTDRSRVMLRDVKLWRGTRVEGRLDDSIPRPIINGHVSAWIVRTIPIEGQPHRGTRWLWLDKVPIAEDGTFVFESMPTGEVLQLIPVCDDWVALNPTQEDVFPFFPEVAGQLPSWITLPQLMQLDGPLVEPVLKMAPATSVKVTVEDPEGKPLSGVEIVMGPGQFWFDVGTQTLGDGGCTAEGLVQIREKGARNFTFEKRFSAKTDENGVAIIRSLPPGRKNEWLVAFLDGYEMPLNDGEREIQVETKPGEVTEVTIKMQPAGTEVLKDKTFQGDDDGG